MLFSSVEILGGRYHFERFGLRIGLRSTKRGVLIGPSGYVLLCLQDQ